MLFFFITLCFGNGLFAQQNESEKQVEILLDSALQKFAVVNVKESANLAQKALELSKKIKYHKGENYSKIRLAQALHGLGKNKEALEHLASAEKDDYTKADAFLLFEIHRIRGRIYGALSYFRLCIDEQKKGLAYISQIKKSKKDRLFLKSLVDENLSVAYSRAGMLDSSYYYLNEKMKYLKTADVGKSYPSKINTYNLLALYFEKKNTQDSAKYYIYKALSLSKKYKYPFIYESNVQMGDIYFKENRVDSALYYYNKALGVLEETSSGKYNADIYKKVSESYLKIGDIAKYKKFEEKYLATAKEGHKNHIETTETIFSEIVNEQKKDEYEKNKKYLFYIYIMAGLFVIILLFSVYLIRRKIIKNAKEKLKIKRDIISEKEEQLAKKENVINELEIKVNESFHEIIQLANENSPEFLVRFKEIYPDFIAALLSKESGLRNSELTLCAFLYLGFNSKDIARITHKSVSTIDNRKYNLKKKLNAPADQGLALYFQNMINNR